MNDTNHQQNKYLFKESRSLNDYIQLIHTNLISFTVIFILITLAAIIYAYSAVDIYRSTVTLKIAKQQQSVLESKGLSEISDLSSDRFIANELEIMKNYDVRERQAQALIDSFNNSDKKESFSLIKSVNADSNSPGDFLIKLTELLRHIVSAAQITGLDVVEISAESPSPYEAALIANTCAEQYRGLNLESNRNLLSFIRKFLEKQRKEKLNELSVAEDTLKRFQEKGKIIALNAQSTALINQLSGLDAQRDAARIELMTSNEVLEQYKNEITRQDPHLADYLESQTSQAYIGVLQKQIAELQMNRDLAMANKAPSLDISGKLKDYDNKITELKNKLKELINNIKTGAFASSPEQIKDLTQKLIEEEVNNHSLSIKLKEYESIINKYEGDFNLLPEKSIELAQYERKRESLQQLYLLVEQRYQEAMINEMSQPGNVIVIGQGRIPVSPSKPNRILIVIIGIMAGMVLSVVFLLIKEYFTDKVKTPSDIQGKDINILTWVPHFSNNGKDHSPRREIFIKENPDSQVSEAFKVLRTRLLFSGKESGLLKTILVTSPAESEGKTFTSVNLAASFAFSNRKALLVDCDLRKPRIHSIIGVDKSPGLSDYLSGSVKFERVIHNTGIDNLSFIASGTLPSDPADLLETSAMQRFLIDVKNRFDIILLDSPPIVAVVDSEILSRLADGTILVVSADKTEIPLVNIAINLTSNNKMHSFLGVVFNNFKNKNAYGYYNKYYYNYNSKAKRHSKLDKINRILQH